MGKRVLITGASGFLGKMVFEKLSEKNYEVHLVSNSRSINFQTAHKANLLDFEQITELIDTVRPDYIIHLAWITNPTTYLSSPENVHWVASGIHMLERFKERGGKRFISAGTCFEYDMQFQFLREQTPAGNASLYGVSKRAFYDMALRYSHDVNISYACGRIFFMYGENDKLNRAVPYAINKLSNNEKAICNSADAFRDYMHVSDGADAFIKLMESDYIGAVNIASGIPVSMGTIFTEVARQLKREKFLELNNMLSGYKNIVADIEVMKKELCFTPKISIEEGIARTIKQTRG